jgi:hypothetical protein
MDVHSNCKELEAIFTEKKYELPIPEEFAIKIALNRITKRNNNKEVNCGACGFNKCKDLACAIAQNTAIPEMCVTNVQIGNRETSLSSKKNEEELEMIKNELSTTKTMLDETRELL